MHDNDDDESAEMSLAFEVTPLKCDYRELIFEERKKMQSQKSQTLHSNCIIHIVQKLEYQI